jgi:hypothetical protein
MLVALFMLGRGRSTLSTKLLVALGFVPMCVLFAVGIAKSNLFDARYFAESTPALLILMAAVIARGFGSPGLRRLVAGLLVVSLVAGFVDQQVNRQNPRLYDFEGALARVRQIAGPHDVVVFVPADLNRVIGYYAAGDELPVPRPGHKVVLLGSFLNEPGPAAKTGGVLSRLRKQGELVNHFTDTQIKVWVFQ